MSLPLLPVVLIVASLTAGCSAAAPVPPMSAEELFPLEEGRTYAFKTSRGTIRGGDATITLSDISKGHGYWSLDFWCASSDRMTLGLTRDSTGIGLLVLGMGHGAMPVDPPLLLVPSTVVEGVPWSSAAKIGTQKPEAKAELAKALARDPQMRSAEFTTRGSDASTPMTAGDKPYRARSVELRLSMNGPKGERVEFVLARLWIAAGVGIVKVELHQDGAGDSPPAQTWELTEIQRKP